MVLVLAVQLQWSLVSEQRTAQHFWQLQLKSTREECHLALHLLMVSSILVNYCIHMNIHTSMNMRGLTRLDVRGSNVCDIMLCALHCIGNGLVKCVALFIV